MYPASEQILAVHIPRLPSGNNGSPLMVFAEHDGLVRTVNVHNSVWPLYKHWRAPSSHIVAAKLSALVISKSLLVVICKTQPCFERLHQTVASCVAAAEFPISPDPARRPQLAERANHTSERLSKRYHRWTFRLLHLRRH
jgi:hypothetical protein